MGDARQRRSWIRKQELHRFGVSYDAMEEIFCDAMWAWRLYMNRRGEHWTVYVQERFRAKEKMIVLWYGLLVVLDRVLWDVSSRRSNHTRRTTGYLQTEKRRYGNQERQSPWSTHNDCGESRMEPRPSKMRWELRELTFHVEVNLSKQEWNNMKLALLVKGRSSNWELLSDTAPLSYRATLLDFKSTISFVVSYYVVVLSSSSEHSSADFSPYQCPNEK